MNLPKMIVFQVALGSHWHSYNFAPNHGPQSLFFFFLRLSSIDKWLADSTVLSTFEERFLLFTQPQSSDLKDLNFVISSLKAIFQKSHFSLLPENFRFILLKFPFGKVYLWPIYIWFEIENWSAKIGGKKSTFLIFDGKSK